MRLDASYPWLPVLLDWRAGELARYAAMLVPHQVLYFITMPLFQSLRVRRGLSLFNGMTFEILSLQMNMRMGVVFNPEALELFVMQKVFIVYSWLKQHDIPKPRLKTSDMARMLGFGIGDELYDLIDKHPLKTS